MSRQTNGVKRLPCRTLPLPNYCRTRSPSGSASACRSMRLFPGSPNSPPSPRIAATAASAAAGAARTAAAPVRLRAVGAVEERPAAGRHRHRRGQGGAAASRTRSPTCPGSATRRRSWCSSPMAPRAGDFRVARQAVSQRPSRPVLQRGGGLLDRARDLHPRRRSGRARLLPDQRDPRSCRLRERPAGLPERVVPVAGMCVGWPSERATSQPRLGSTPPCTTTATASATSPPRSTPMTAAARRTGPMRASAIRSVGRGAVLRLVGGQGPPIRRTAARRFRRLRAHQGLPAGVAARIARITLR